MLPPFTTDHVPKHHSSSSPHSSNSSHSPSLSSPTFSSSSPSHSKSQHAFQGCHLMLAMSLLELKA